MTDLPLCPHAEIARLQKDLQFARAEAAAHRDAFEAELEGSRELRLIMGAREKETMWDVVERVVKERDEARAGAHRFQMDAAMLAFLIEAAHTNVARGVSAAEQIEELYRSMLIVAVKNPMADLLAAAEEMITQTEEWTKHHVISLQMVHALNGLRAAIAKARQEPAP